MPEKKYEPTIPLFTEHDDSGIFVPNIEPRRGFTVSSALDPEAQSPEAPTDIDLTAAHTLGDLIPLPIVPGLSDKELAARNRFIRGNFKWIPGSEQAVSIANRTLRLRVKDNAHKHLNVLTEILNTADSFWGNAANARHTLQEAATGEEPWYEPSISAVRNNPEIMLVLATYVYNKDCLDKFKWLDRTHKSGKPNPDRERALIASRQAVERFSDTDLDALWRQAYSSYAMELLHWNNQVRSVEDIERVREARRPKAA